MATDKICTVCGAIDAASLVVGITYNDTVLDVGASLGGDLCATHRSAFIDDLFIQCKTNIEAVITGA
jgi:hypothetical protein